MAGKPSPSPTSSPSTPSSSRRALRWAVGRLVPRLALPGVPTCLARLCPVPAPPYPNPGHFGLPGLWTFPGLWKSPCRWAKPGFLPIRSRIISSPLGEPGNSRARGGPSAEPPAAPALYPPDRVPSGGAAPPLLPPCLPPVYPLFNPAFSLPSPAFAPPNPQNQENPPYVPQKPPFWCPGPVKTARCTPRTVILGYGTPQYELRRAHFCPNRAQNTG